MKPDNSTLLSIGLIISGIICLLLFRLADSHINAQGILQEPFALLGSGYLLLASGLLTALVLLIRRLLHMQ